VEQTYWRVSYKVLGDLEHRGLNNWSGKLTHQGGGVGGVIKKGEIMSQRINLTFRSDRRWGWQDVGFPQWECKKKTNREEFGGKGGKKGGEEGRRGNMGGVTNVSFIRGGRAGAFANRMEKKGGKIRNREALVEDCSGDGRLALIILSINKGTARTKLRD